jgi:hypothetical protein
MGLRCKSEIALNEQKFIYQNVVSGMVENLHRKKFLPARIGVGGCRLSARPSVYMTLLNNF